MRSDSVADTTDAEQVQRVFDELSDAVGRRAQRAHQRGRARRASARSKISPTISGGRPFDDGVMGMVHCVAVRAPAAAKGSVGRGSSTSPPIPRNVRASILPAYTAAKAALTSISKNLSLLLAKDEIMVNVVSPGSIASEALVGWAASVGVDGNDPYALMAAIDKHFGHPAPCHAPVCPTKSVPSSRFSRPGAIRT